MRFERRGIEVKIACNERSWRTITRLGQNNVVILDSEHNWGRKTGRKKNLWWQQRISCFVNKRLKGWLTMLFQKLTEWIFVPRFVNASNLFSPSYRINKAIYAFD